MDKTIYISGPMTGIVDHNFPAFNAAEASLREMGFTNIINPAYLGVTQGFLWEDYMRRDIKLLMDATDLVLLEGWGASKGARLEVFVAVHVGINVWLDLEMKTKF
jgi:hypothetical protein